MLAELRRKRKYSKLYTGGGEGDAHFSHGVSQQEKKDKKIKKILENAPVHDW